MCMSRYHRVLSHPDAGRVAVADLDGTHHVVSLLAYEGPDATPGDWVVVHSGFALGPADSDEVAGVLAAWHSIEHRQHTQEGESHQ